MSVIAFVSDKEIFYYGPEDRKDLWKDRENGSHEITVLSFLVSGRVEEWKETEGRQLAIRLDKTEIRRENPKATYL